MTKTSVWSALRKRYAAPEWALMFEVANATGHVRRRADALAMSLWRSRGLHLHGFEIKTARGDWLRELRDPDKSATIQKYCDFWWIATEKGVVKETDAFPATWGHLELRGGKLYTVRKAPPLEPEPIDRRFFAALCRSINEVQATYLSKAEYETQLEALVAERVAMRHTDLEHRLKRETERADKLARVIREFETAAGLQLDKWYPEGNRDLGAAVRAIVRTGVQGQIASLDRQREALVRAAAQVAQAHDDLVAVADMGPTHAAEADDGEELAS